LLSRGIRIWRRSVCLDERSDSIPLGTIPWSRLLREINAKQVLPIIGPGLVTVERDCGHVPFTEWLAPEFARLLGLAPVEGMTLNRAACAKSTP
jgi:hypothetical protein